MNPIIEKYNLGETILIDKSLDWTSFDVVKKIRNTIKCKKVGHAGTLDPLATGLLILCTGKNTKKINDYQNYPKEYIGTFVLGKTTPSHDLETEINFEKSTKDINEKDIHSLASTFLGIQDQLPPKFSAVKINGKRAYSLARNNEKITLKKKEIEIFKFDITTIKMPEVNFVINCSKGTYIRSIARDFGKKIGSGAYLSKLRRTKIGTFNVSDALNVNEMIKIINKEKIESNK
jgi:tRNA pseudouridine55 synthase|tara:strand:- start:1700 stop:2398 length:699 start_codon:yes stop_codon:yes gene_type:complete